MDAKVGIIREVHRARLLIKTIGLIKAREKVSHLIVI